MAATQVRALEAADIDFRFVIWCDLDGTNDGTAADDGYLQGATISTSAWTLDTGLTEAAENTNSITIDGVTYDASTVATIKLSVDNATYVDQTLTAVNQITTSDGRTLNHTLLIPII